MLQALKSFHEVDLIRAYSSTWYLRSLNEANTTYVTEFVALSTFQGLLPRSRNPFSATQTTPPQGQSPPFSAFGVSDQQQRGPQGGVPRSSSGGLLASGMLGSLQQHQYFALPVHQQPPWEGMAKKPMHGHMHGHMPRNGGGIPDAEEEAEEEEGAEFLPSGSATEPDAGRRVVTVAKAPIELMMRLFQAIASKVTTGGGRMPRPDELVTVMNNVMEGSKAFAQVRFDIFCVEVGRSEVGPGVSHPIYFWLC